MRAPGMALSIRSYGGDERVHAHEFHQIVLPVAGRMEMRVGGWVRSLVRRVGVLVVGGTAHGFRGCGENRVVVLDVPAAILPDGILARAAAAPFFAVDAPLDHLACYLDGTASLGALDATVVYHAASLLSRAIGRGAIARQATASSCRGDGIAQARALIEARYGEALSAAELAGAARMGLSRFYERFRNATGETPAEYLARTRLDRAGELLRETAMPLAEIALAVGFSDQSALTRSFRRRRGTTPAAVRRASRQSANGEFEDRIRIESAARPTML